MINTFPIPAIIVSFKNLMESGGGGVQDQIRCVAVDAKNSAINAEAMNK